MFDVKAARSQPCRYFAQGLCRRGDQCWYKHERPCGDQTQASMARALSPSASVFVPLNPSTGAINDCASSSSSTSQNEAGSEHTEGDMHSGSGASEDVSNDDHACVVCFEKPKSYGLLESCAHVFCLNCIREWRTAKGKSREQIDNGVLHKCPACRVSSRNIIPSHFWLGQGPEKEAFIAGYKAKMSQVPCRNFAASLDDAEGGGQPFCPFGKDCFYKHALPDGTLHVFEHGMAEHAAQTRRERDQRRLETHLRTFYDLWRRGQLRDEDMDDDSEYDDGDEEWTDDGDEWGDTEGEGEGEDDEAMSDSDDAGPDGFDDDVGDREMGDDEDDTAFQRDLAHAIALSQREAGLSDEPAPLPADADEREAAAEQEFRRARENLRRTLVALIEEEEAARIGSTSTWQRRPAEQEEEVQIEPPRAPHPRQRAHGRQRTRSASPPERDA